MGEIMCNKPSLLNGGVVYTVLQTLGVTSDPSNLQVWLYGAPNRFFHPQNGDLKEVNDKIYKWVLERVGKDHPQLPSILPLEEKGFSLNLPHLAAAQLAGVGVPPNNIHLDDAYWKNEELVWLEGRPGAPRNLCIVVNRFAY
ncbi:MAG: hypothetical protein QG621_550 [Patescibacteria group bacterium]|nr:hypothetical protein [Patescibacteria group bacterium]